MRLVRDSKWAPVLKTFEFDFDEVQDFKSTTAEADESTGGNRDIEVEYEMLMGSQAMLGEVLVDIIDLELKLIRRELRQVGVTYPSE